ncbi:GAF domain-containing protein [Lysinibacillus xylanilyticus]|uniref:GAF domain-containing protein n=1 Tax=Lysinibacillus xylanilyticus TaxID=582475 RepID=UPI0038021D88
MILFNTFLPTISEWISLLLLKFNLIKEEKDFDKWDLYSVLGVVYLSFCIVRFIGNIWRTNEKIEIGTAVTSFPNPFYDPTFKKKASDLDRSYRTLTVDYNKKLELLKEAGEHKKGLIDSLNQIEVRLRILMRHNKNGNRIIRSLNYSYFRDEKLPVDEGLKLIIEECITVLEKDQSDKSISLFKVEGNQLKIASSVRINFESVDKRVFNKGEGFAGYIWERNAPEIVNNIKENDSRFEDGGLPATKIGSILGYPLAIEDQVVGVLCLQSESEEGFKKSDLITVEFYVRLCTFLMIHDKIK